MEDTKKCSVCGEVKCIEEFYIVKEYKGTKYRRPQCKVCYNAINTEFHRNKVNAEKAKRDQTVFVSTTHKLCTQCKAYKPFDNFRTDSKTGKLFGACIECKRAMSRRTYYRNPDKYMENDRRRRANKKKALGKHSNKDIREILAAQEGKCVYCGYEFKPKNNGKLDYEIDHIYPLENDWFSADFKENLQLLCDPCNGAKWKHDPVKYEEKIGFLTDARWKYLLMLKTDILKAALDHWVSLTWPEEREKEVA